MYVCFRDLGLVLFSVFCVVGMCGLVVVWPLVMFVATWSHRWLRSSVSLLDACRLKTVVCLCKCIVVCVGVIPKMCSEGVD